MIKKNWRQIDKMVLDAMDFVNDYCDRTDLCDDCVLFNSDKDCCMLKSDDLIELHAFIKERKND